MNNNLLISICSALLLFLAPGVPLAVEEELEGVPLAEEEELEGAPLAEGEELEGEMLDEGVAEEAVEKGRFTLYGDVELGGQIIEQDGNSSKFNEYKDDETDPYVNRLYFGIEDAETNHFLDFRGRRLSRDDQEMYLEFGSYRDPESSSYGGWSVDFDWNETPHLLSNSAMTPYDYLGGGRYRVAQGIVDAIQIFSIDTAQTWTAPDAGPGGFGEDARIASVLRDSVHGIDLGTQRQTGTSGFNLYFSERTKARFEFQFDDKEGSIVTGVGIGDRPPRTMNVQLPEPIDYQTYDFRFSLEHISDNFNIDASYLFSIFENDIETMTWNSLFHAANFNCATIPACAGATDFDRIRANANLIGYRSTEYATTGDLPLTPDNTFHNFSINGGINLPWMSRLSASFAYGLMQQDEDLLPYASSNFGGVLPTLPRTSADAEIDTTMFNVAYAINPFSRLSLNLHYRYYDMDNNTSQDVWTGTTQDTDSFSFLSQRINIPYDLQQDNLGADLSYYLGKAGTLGFTYEKEFIERPDREVEETDEDIYKVSYRVRPTNWAGFMAKYTKGLRDGDTYNGEITDQSYAYDFVANQAQGNNPLASFGNAPGLRKFDVTDRDKDEFDVSLNLLPLDRININLGYNYRHNDYDGDILSTITTWDSVALAFLTAPIDPTQLGLLEDKTNRYMAEINYTPTDKLSMYGFYSREEYDQKQRGRYLDEDNRNNQTSGNIAAGTKDWQGTDGSNIWNADIEDDTNTIGIGVNYLAMEDKLDLNADFTHTSGTVAIDYSAGFRLVEDNTTSFHNHAEWSSPSDADFETNTINLRLRYNLTKQLTFGLGYTFEAYRVNDWQQDADSAHKRRLSDNFVTEIDGETAGTSNDRAGSRLVTLDDVLAPDYDVHWGIITIQYRW